MRGLLLSLLILISCSRTFADYCAFCDSIVLDNQTFYEEELVLVLYNHKPIFPGHSLIIPKRHLERFEHLTEEEITQIGQAIKKTDQLVSKVLHTSAYLIAEKNGREVGQSVPHLHFHYIPRKSGEDSILYFLWASYLAQIKKPLLPITMREMINLLKKANADFLLLEEKKT